MTAGAGVTATAAPACGQALAPPVCQVEHPGVSPVGGARESNVLAALDTEDSPNAPRTSPSLHRHELPPMCPVTPGQTPYRVVTEEPDAVHFGRSGGKLLPRRHCRTFTDAQDNISRSE